MFLFGNGTAANAQPPTPAQPEGNGLQQLDMFRQDVDSRFRNMDASVQELTNRLDRHDERLAELDKIAAGVDVLRNRIAQLDPAPEVAPPAPVPEESPTPESMMMDMMSTGTGGTDGGLDDQMREMERILSL